eukprot:TRINITY_DN33723_c0_g1_i1.p1 TRINITY_DN33723_c0_g1~~TRINITY_DN33723_c0_g1_i1.p1  ORF type:complete len:638 (+),score=131.67 TRINITY_DN33723_c0_g1_i1:35-1948(+)
MTRIHEAFPNLSADAVEELLTGFEGDEERALHFLLENDTTQKKRKHEPEKTYPPATVETLKSRFPEVDDSLLRDVCDLAGNDWNKAMTQLLSYGLIPVFESAKDKEETKKKQLKQAQQEEEEKQRKIEEEERVRAQKAARNIQSNTRKATVATLKMSFPDAEVDLLRETADDCGGNWDKVVEKLESYGFTPADVQVKKVATAETLQTVFSNVDLSLLTDVADTCRGDWNAALQQLASFGCQPDDDGDLPHEESWPEFDRETSDNYFDREETDHTDDDEIYSNALASGDDLKKAAHAAATSELMKASMARIERQMKEVDKTLKEREHQRKLGPQSCRGMSTAELRTALKRGDSTAHASKCFEKMLERETEHCGEYVVFYHSYSFAALMYEVQAAIAKVLYGLPDGFGALPRLLKEPFNGKPHISLLLADFSSMGQQDHDPKFRQLAISVSVSLLAPASEAPPISVFNSGYSCNDLSFHGIMTTLFKTLGLTTAQTASLISDLVTFGNKWGLSGDMYAASQSNSSYGQGNKGHMIQMFINTAAVDDLAYASHAMGVIDDSRNPLSKSLTGKKWPDGQARIFVHPSMFLDPKQVKIYHYAADENLHRRRLQFQDELIRVLHPLLGKPENLVRAFKGVEGK